MWCLFNNLPCKCQTINMTEVNHHSLCKYGKVNSTRNAFIWHYYAINWQCVWYGYDLL